LAGKNENRESDIKKLIPTGIEKTEKEFPQLDRTEAEQGREG
jgi:hypothetical protein